MLTLDAVTRLCVVCGTDLPVGQVRTATDVPDGSCKLCGSLVPSLNSPEQIAEVVSAADSCQLRAERLRIIEDSAAVEQEWRQVRGLDRNREDELWSRRNALRAVFLASIGAVPVPLPFYTVWLDSWERDAGRKAHTSERSFGESELSQYERTAALYPSDLRCWLATIPFRGDEMLPLFGAQQLALFLPSSTSAEFLRDIDGRNMPLLGHSSVQGLKGRGRSLHAWSFGDKPFLPTAYTDVDELRSKRLRMRTLRRTWGEVAPGGDGDIVTGMGELWPIEKVAEFLGCSPSRARAIMADRGITRISGYPAAKVQQVQRRQGARTDLTR